MCLFVDCMNLLPRLWKVSQKVMGGSFGEEGGAGGNALSSLSRGCTQPGMIATFWTTARAPEAQTLPIKPIAEPEMPYSRLRISTRSGQDRRVGGVRATADSSCWT